MIFGFSIFDDSNSGLSLKSRIHKKLNDLKCENTNIWIQDIFKIKIEVSSILYIFNLIDIDQKTMVNYLTPEIIDLDPYRLHFVKFFRLKSFINEKMNKSIIINLNKFITNTENLIGIKNKYERRKVWTEEENVVHDVKNFICNRFYNNYDIKMFLLNHINEENKNYKLIVNKNQKKLIIEEEIKKFRINKSNLKKLKSFSVNLNGEYIHLKKESIGRILKQSQIKENILIKQIIYFRKLIKKNYEITIKYHKIIYPEKIKKELRWIEDENEYSEKIKRKDIYLFDELIVNAENYYNMIIEDENRRLREFGLIPLKRSKSRDYIQRNNNLFKRFWGGSQKDYSEDSYFYDSLSQIDIEGYEINQNKKIEDENHKISKDEIKISNEHNFEININNDIKKIENEIKYKSKNNKKNEREIKNEIKKERELLKNNTNEKDEDNKHNLSDNGEIKKEIKLNQKMSLNLNENLGVIEDIDKKDIQNKENIGNKDYKNIIEINNNEINNSISNNDNKKTVDSINLENLNKNKCNKFKDIIYEDLEDKYIKNNKVINIVKNKLNKGNFDSNDVIFKENTIIEDTNKIKLDNKKEEDIIIQNEEININKKKDIDVFNENNKNRESKRY